MGTPWAACGLDRPGLGARSSDRRLREHEVPTGPRRRGVRVLRHGTPATPRGVPRPRSTRSTTTRRWRSSGISTPGEWLDELGFDEVWIGEHRSGELETIDSPEVLIAAAAERTSHIRLGTGVISLPYHHPLNAANRLIQLDHMTRGRVLSSAGPGRLASDAPDDGHRPGDDP